MRSFSFLCAASMLALLPAFAAAQHSDVLLRSDGAQVVIGAAADLDAEEGGPFFDLETNVFEAVLLNPEVPSPPFFPDFETDEPGFFTSPSVPVGQNLPANSLVTLTPSAFSVGAGNDTLHFWDGSGEVDFQPISVAQPGVTFEAVEDEPLLVDDVNFLDGHPIWSLFGGAADGVYLTSYTASAPGLEASDPFFLVFLAESDLMLESQAEAVEEALEELEENGTPAIVGGIDFSFFEEAVEFVEAIPEPTSLVLAALGLGVIATRRR